METAAKYEVQTVKSEIINMEDYAMTTDRLVRQVKLIQSVMKEVMVKDEHYGIIPGCEKPSLYKSGAEKLSMTFRLVPKYETKQTDLSNGHREYQVTCTLIHAPTGQFFGEGLGSCNTMEAKYRYRNADPEITDRPVPKEYWGLRKQNKMNQAQELIGGKGFTTKKTDSGWFIAKKSGAKVEHDNPADYYNTVLKMAAKRALVGVTLNATAASDIFTQDMEDTTEPVESKEEVPNSTQTAPPGSPIKEKSLFEQLMSARGNFSKLVTDNKDALLDFLPDELKAIKERWEKASAQGVGGVTKGSPWPFQEAKEEKPLFDVENPIQDLRNEILQCKELLDEAGWKAIFGFYRSWETSGDMDSLTAMLKQCRSALDKQHDDQHA